MNLTLKDDAAEKFQNLRGSIEDDEADCIALSRPLTPPKEQDLLEPSAPNPPQPDHAELVADENPDPISADNDGSNDTRLAELEQEKEAQDVPSNVPPIETVSTSPMLEAPSSPPPPAPIQVEPQTVVQGLSAPTTWQEDVIQSTPPPMGDRFRLPERFRSSVKKRGANPLVLC